MSMKYLTMPSIIFNVTNNNNKEKYVYYIVRRKYKSRQFHTYIEAAVIWQNSMIDNCNTVLIN